MRRGGGGGVVIWHAEKRIEGPEEEEKEKEWKQKQKKKKKASPHLPASLISPSSCPRLPISTSLGQRPNREHERETMQSKSRKNDFYVVISLSTPSSCSSWLAKIFAVVSGVFRGLDLPKYEVLRAAIPPWLEGLATMGYFFN